jgi:alpha-N-arabinofuranosidase
MTVSGLPAHEAAASPVRDEFASPVGPQWNYLRNPVRESYSTSARPGWLTLRGTAATLDEEASPTFLGRRQQHLRVRMATQLDFAPAGDREEAGLVLYRHPRHRYELGIRRTNGQREVFVRQTIGARLSAVTASARVPDGPLVLQVDAQPEEYTFSWGTPAGALTRLDAGVTRFLSSEVAGGFIGTYIGLYATGNGRPAAAPAAFDWFDYEPAGER